MHNPASTSFEEYLSAVRGKSANTVGAYLADTHEFAYYCEARGLKPESALSRINVSLYLLKRMEPDKGDSTGSAAVSSRTAARIVSSLKAWGDFLVFTSKQKENPVRNLQPPRYSRKLPSYFRVEEIISLIAAYDGNPKPAYLRNSAILHLLYAGGLRVSECAALDLGSLKSHGTVRVTGKGNKQREVPIGDRTLEVIRLYLTQGRPRLSTVHSGTALWLNSRDGRRLTARSMRNILNEAALRSGLAKPVSPHKLRHACATHMLEGGADIRLLQEFLGHESLNTTQVYTQITRTHLRDVYLDTHPRAKKDKSDR